MALFRTSGPRVLLMCEQRGAGSGRQGALAFAMAARLFSPRHQLPRFFMHAHTYCWAYHSAELQSAMLDSVRPIYRKILKESLRRLPRGFRQVI